MKLRSLLPPPAPETILVRFVVHDDFFSRNSLCKSHEAFNCTFWKEKGQQLDVLLVLMYFIWSLCSILRMLEFFFCSIMCTVDFCSGTISVVQFV
jgi:hypothetical protein